MSKCASIKIENSRTNILIIDKTFRKTKLIKEINLDIGIKNLVSLKSKKDYIDTVSKELKKQDKLKKIFFLVQNTDVIIREYRDLYNIKKRDILGYINFEIGQDMPINLSNYIIKYKILNQNKKRMDLQVIMFPKYLEKICRDIVEATDIKYKYLNMDFDVLQKLIDLKSIDIKDDSYYILQNMMGEIILNKIENKLVQSSNSFEKEDNLDYIGKFIDKDNHIFFYGIEDEFLKKLKDMDLKVDKLEIKYKPKALWIDDSVDKHENNYLIHLGMVM